MKTNTIEQELQAIRQHLAAQRLEAPDLLQVLERLAVAVDGLEKMAEDLRVENEELLETRQAVEVERQRYLTLFEFAPDGYLVTDLSGYIQEANRAAVAMFGRPRAYLVGKPLLIFVPAKEHSAFRSRLAQLTTETRVHGWELSLELPTGEQIHAAANVVALRAVASAPASLQWIIRDISKRKRAEARVNATLEAAPAAMLMVNSAGSIVLVNAEAERMFGYARRELQGRRVEVLVPERFRGQHSAWQLEYVSSPQARRMGAGRELFGLRKDGSDFPVEIGLSPIHMEDGLFVLAA
ncbi:MAG TPA: PAS domain S-box protein, partial [Candidatus Acidoferrum sp.]|nr:PAS domain S-box protein [Candidatus Acidoferrum sp.]